METLGFAELRELENFTSPNDKSRNLSPDALMSSNLTGRWDCVASLCLGVGATDSNRTASRDRMARRPLLVRAANGNTHFSSLSINGVSSTTISLWCNTEILARGRDVRRPIIGTNVNLSGVDMRPWR